MKTITLELTDDQLIALDTALHLRLYQVRSPEFKEERIARGVSKATANWLQYEALADIQSLIEKVSNQ